MAEVSEAVRAMRIATYGHRVCKKCGTPLENEQVPNYWYDLCMIHNVVDIQVNIGEDVIPESVDVRIVGPPPQLDNDVVDQLQRDDRRWPMYHKYATDMVQAQEHLARLDEACQRAFRDYEATAVEFLIVAINPTGTGMSLSEVIAKPGILKPEVQQRMCDDLGVENPLTYDKAAVEAACVEWQKSIVVRHKGEAAVADAERAYLQLAIGHEEEFGAGDAAGLVRLARWRARRAFLGPSIRRVED